MHTFIYLFVFIIADNLKATLVKERKAQITSDLATESESEKGIGCREKKKPGRLDDSSSESDLAIAVEVKVIPVSKQRCRSKDEERHSLKESLMPVRTPAEIHFIDEPPKSVTAPKQVQFSTNKCLQNCDMSRLQGN